MLHRWLACSLFLLLLWVAVASCKSTPDTLCTPGENIFCKCRGGSEGTKTCKPGGQSFDTCVSDTGDCTEIPATTTSATTTAGHGSAQATTSSGTGGASSLPLFSPCSDASECKSGECKNHYCTLDCGNYKDCVDGTITGDCVRFANNTIQICAPYCTLQPDCSQYGAASACGGATALDDPNFVFAVCGDWGAELRAMPLGSSCTDTPSCSLGLVGYEEVCVAQKCTKGCLVQSDCPNGTVCPSDGTNFATCG